MKTDYFNLIESKVNTAEIIKKKISKILDNQQTGGVHFGHMAAKFAANKLATSPMAQNAMNDGAISMGQNAMNSVGETNKKKIKTEKGKDKENDKHKKEEDKKNKKQKQKQKDKLLKKIKPNTQISPDYPQLQVIPRNPHMTKKLSNKFSVHIDKVQSRIEETEEKIESQSSYIEEEQRINDEKNEILSDKLHDELKDDATRSMKIILVTGQFVKWAADNLMSIIRWFFTHIIRFIISMHPFMWALIAIICVFVLVMLLAWLLYGDKISIDHNEGEKKQNNHLGAEGDKESSSSNYGSSGTKPDWDWNYFLKSPIKYSLKRTISDTKYSLNIPDILKKVNVLSPIYTFRKNFNLLNNDNFKMDRKACDFQRDDSISFINWKLIDSTVANKLSDAGDEYHSISLLKPKNIEWELPHLDYKTKDMDKLPESIKNYKNNDNPDDYSLNDTSKIIFPWKKVANEWVLDCDTKFTNNKSTDLYIEEDDYCIANTENNANKYSRK